MTAPARRPTLHPTLAWVLAAGLGCGGPDPWQAMRAVARGELNDAAALQRVEAAELAVLRGPAGDWAAAQAEAAAQANVEPEALARAADAALAAGDAEGAALRVALGLRAYAGARAGGRPGSFAATATRARTWCRGS
jgi:hypothetical protein